MDFAYSEKVKGLRKQLNDFMQRFIYPNEQTSPVQMPPTSSFLSGGRAMNMSSMAASGGFQARHESAAKYSSPWVKPIPITRIDTASRVWCLYRETLPA